ncbi:cold shock domain-containing protein [Tamlana sp. s12]|uniref:cold-shock protein n=1 Tax=Flavobacteriaceae TaxID=49546 RepID=UPI0007FFC2AD|nr:MULTISPECIES: cold shock domain-containing protein [Tamlana]OBQ52494.1 DNA-binding protein [Tamlana sp. s12]QQY81436.1 cold shock domain-containing protein [Tamlana sp. s12]
MAKSQVTFNKIEKEKKRLKKREEKQKKKEARRAEAKENPQGIQFAYVDFNGNLTDTPPDPAMREKIEAESIELGIPKKEDRIEEEPVAKEGKVSFFDHSKGFGFIIDSVNQEKYFVHISGTLEPIEENDKVTYELERGQKGMNAVQVKKI